MSCQGIKLVFCDGESAYQTVFHFHLHVIPRYPEDGLDEPFKVEPQERGKSLRDSDTQDRRRSGHRINGLLITSAHAASRARSWPRGGARCRADERTYDVRSDNRS
jgi:hypothetical protein